MKRYFSLIILIAIGGTALSQNRQDIAGFSQFNQYFNPALTGNDGTSVKSFYRDQMTSFEDAPKTLFLSGEANISDLTGKKSNNVAHGVGLAVLHDAFGALRDNRVNLSYSAGIKISSKMQLKAGAAFTYNNVKLDTDVLSLSEADDASYLSLLNGNNTINKYGVNIGVAISSDDFYAGYSLNDAVKSGDNNRPYYNDVYAVQHALQIGYRRAFSDDLGFVVNGIFRYDTHQKGIGEGQLKAVFLNTFWVGAGYRQDIAYTFNTGVRLKQFRVSYSRELNANKVSGAYRGGNELILSYNFTPLFGMAKKALDIW